MRTLLLAASLLVVTSVRADDSTKEFLNPDNWQGLEGLWKIEGDTVIGTSPPEGQKFNTFLCSKKKYKDFELACKVQLKNGQGNSGFQIRSRIHDQDKLAVTGPQCDVGAGYWGSLYGENFGGMMKQSPAEAIKGLKNDAFNDYWIQVKGKHVTIKVNGVTTVDQEFEKLPEEGIFAFQLHAGGPMQVTFKDIKFKELK